MKILVVDHDPTDRIDLAKRLVARGHQLVTASDGRAAVECLGQGRFDLVFTNSHAPHVNGLELLRHVKVGDQQDTLVVLITSNGSIPAAVRAMKMGAFDFLKKPIGNKALTALLEEAARNHPEPDKTPEVARAGDAREIDREIVGNSTAIERVKRMIRIAAKTDANILIHGETGVGKDLVASMIHRQSHRRRGPYVKVGCTLLPPSLIESELYGHEEGSFTGAEQHRTGRFELADGGTIYLDDVDDIPLEQQAKLLRVIEEKVFERVGGTKLIRANVRIVASTKLNLLDKVADATFRQDLYYRLDVLRLRIPALRQRREDIPALTDHLLNRIAGRQPHQIQPEAVQTLCNHTWPGNVRELYHTLERAWLMGDGHIQADLLEADLRQTKAAVRADSDGSPIPDPLALRVDADFKATMDFAEKQLLANALQASGGNKTAAASALGMKPSTFRDKLAKHGLQ